MNDYISKPIDRKALLDVLKKRLPAFTAPSPVVRPNAALRGDDFPELAGIAVHEALTSLDMDFKSYKAYLLAFREEAENAIGALSKFDGRNLPDDISALAHKLAGAAANLRAFQVKDAAATLEQATRQGEIPATLVSELKKALQTFIDAVNFLGETERIDETGNIDLHAACQYTDKIEALITSSDFVEEALILGLERALSESIDPIVLRRLKNSLRDFDYQGAEEAVRAIRAWMDNQSFKEKDV